LPTLFKRLSAQACILPHKECVITYGTFDLFHYGHNAILCRAKTLGKKLVVGVSTDEFNLLKGKKCLQPYHYRKKIIESLPFVDLVIPENSWEQKEGDILKHDADYFVMGDDWEGKFDFLNTLCKVVYFPRTQGVSTTKLKQLILASR
jgi:glycerol-3-phosphate cytidylyltransferase